MYPNGKDDGNFLTLQQSGLDPASCMYVNAVVNPFGTDSKGVDHIDAYAGIGMPTLLSIPTFKYTIYRKGTYTATTDGENAMFGVCKPTGDRATSIGVWIDPNNTGEPTAFGFVQDGINDVGWYTNLIQSRYRIVACGLRANVVSPSEKSSAVLTGTAGDSSTQSISGFGIGPKFSLVMDTAPKQAYAANQGITVRYDPVLSTDSVTSYNYPVEKWSVVVPTCTGQDFNDMPKIFASGMLEGTTLLLEYVMYLELVPYDRTHCPLATTPTPPSNNWQQCLTFIANRDINPVVAHGHSFNDFIRGVGSFLKKVGMGIWNTINDPKKMESVTGIARLIKSIVL